MTEDRVVELGPFDMTPPAPAPPRRWTVKLSGAACPKCRQTWDRVSVAVDLATRLPVYASLRCRAGHYWRHELKPDDITVLE